MTSTAPPAVRAPLSCLLAFAVWSSASAAPPVAPRQSEATNDTASSSTTPASAPPVRGDRHLAASTNFSVRSDDPAHPADRVAAELEQWRCALQQQWLGRVESGWSPRCEVMIYANEDAYLRHLGPRAVMTRGVSRIDRQSGRIVSRHISLLADPWSGELTALAHELTHVVLADRFKRCPPPRWIDEGVALLADGQAKRQLHLRDLQHALTDHRCPALGETFAMRRYPQGPQLATFYGQSLSLVSYLRELGEPAQIVDMAVLAIDRGYDDALRQTYGIAGLAELEQRWRHHLSENVPSSGSRSLLTSTSNR